MKEHPCALCGGHLRTSQHGCLHVEPIPGAFDPHVPVRQVDVDSGRPAVSQGKPESVEDWVSVFASLLEDRWEIGWRIADTAAALWRTGGPAWQVAEGLNLPYATLGKWAEKGLTPVEKRARDRSPGIRGA